MKVIDLLNKIANGEEVPKKVKFAGIIFEYDKDEQMYFTDNYKNICDYVFLDNEVQILEEEEKKIPEKIDQNNFEWKYLYSKKSNEEIINNLNILRLKYNEIIDYLKSKGDE